MQYNMNDDRTNSEKFASPLVADVMDPKEIESPDYSDDDKVHMTQVLQRLTKAKQMKDTNHPEFDGQTYIERYEGNEKVANTVLPSKKNDGEVRMATGTVEQKLFAVLSEINRLNLSPQVLATDNDNNELVQVGQAMTDVIAETEKNDDGAEGKILRQLELLKQGEVFVQERWSKEWKAEKTFDKKKIGKITGAEWKKRFKVVYEGPRREVLYGPGVYLGNIRDSRDLNKSQPFIFTHKLTTIEDVRARYKGWDRLKFVSDKKVSSLSAEEVPTAFGANNAWALTNVEEGFVEEIHYQDRPNNEYQIFLNGVAMLPVGFPLSAVSPNGDYNITRQILQFINPFFGYGRSFVSRVKKQSDVLDELLRLLVIKTRKSIHPPYVNMSGKVISPKVLMPGRISMGISPDALQPIGQESQGATASEYQMFKVLQENIDETTVSKQFTGQQGKSGTTAFEVATLQKQAQKTLTLIIFACTLLEEKLGYARLFNVLDNYFEPTDSRVDEARGMIVNKYRTTSVKTAIPGQGQGIRQVIPTEQLPPAGVVKQQELFAGGNGASRLDAGLPPLKRIYLNPSELRKVRLNWCIEVDTKEKETSNMKKLMFREELSDIITLMNIGSQPNIQALEEEHSNVWGRRQGKLFSQGRQPIQQREGEEKKVSQGTATPPNVGALNITE